MDPSLPASFPFNGQWIRSGIDSGLLGPFLSPAKSVFLFDPMFVLALLLTVLLWKKLTPAVQAFLAATFVMLGAYIVFYARYFFAFSATSSASLAFRPFLLSKSVGWRICPNKFQVSGFKFQVLRLLT